MPDDQSPQLSGSHPVLQVQQDGVAEKFAKKMDAMQKDTTEQLAASHAATLNLPYIDLRKFPIAPEAIMLIPEKVARQLQVVCFYRDADSFRLAAVVPEDERVKELMYQLQERHHAQSGLYGMSSTSLEQAMLRYAAVPVVKEVSHDVTIDAETLQVFRDEVKDFASLQTKIAEINVTDFVALVLAAAVNNSASDIHIEAEKENIAVRYRLDGVLQDVASVDQEKWNRIISRVKLLSGLKINVADKPQDGRFTIVIDGTEIDVRVSSIPTAFGESVVMRLLKPLAEKMEIAMLGLQPRPLAILQDAISKPNGMIITTGPTGSGKTTTLYTVLQQLNTPEVKIITLEDPIEYKLEGIAQSQIESGKEYTFAKGLKSILRQDPDIVLVGEIRELETAEIAIQASLTGHLLLSTIHTNSAPGAIARFLSIGVKPFLLAPSLNIVMGQRLVRRLCDQCKRPVTPDEKTLSKVQEHIAALTPASETTFSMESATWFGPGGSNCEACGGVGYKGRLGIFEIMQMTDAIKDAISGDQVAEHQLAQIAMNDGMVPMVTDGIFKAAQGITSLDEVFRVAV